MIIFKEKDAINLYLSRLQADGKTIGFVPTMGAIHAGHLSLITAAAKASDITVCSIFVNPTQFNDPEDFEKYPIRTEEDILALTEAQTDILFLPAVDEIYESGSNALEAYSFGHLERVLEGASRPGHFQGVGQVMQRLLTIIHPDKLFMGQKDYQQTLIISKLIESSNFKTKLITCPILREKDGLAMSSRNIRLSEEAREKAPVIHQTLVFIKNNFLREPFGLLLSSARQHLEDKGFEIDYLVITDEDLNLQQKPEGGKLICLAAVKIEGIRLIDNLWLN